MCDYLLIVKSDRGSHVIFIELKKTLTPKRKEVAKEQLRRSLPLLDYLLSVCKIEDSSIERARPTTNYVIIAERLKRIAKESVRHKKKWNEGNGKLRGDRYCDVWYNKAYSC